jgi:hypothetical protein
MFGKVFREEVMANSERQVTGIGSGAKDDGMQNIAVPSQDNKDLGPDVAKTNLPFELNVVIPQISDLFEKLVALRNQFEQAKKNPSITPSQQIGLKRATMKLDTINQGLLKLPDFLSAFVVDKR